MLATLKGTMGEIPLVTNEELAILIAISAISTTETKISKTHDMGNEIPSRLENELCFPHLAFHFPASDYQKILGGTTIVYSGSEGHWWIGHWLRGGGNPTLQNKTKKQHH